MARLSTATRYKVVVLHQQGLSQAKISKQTGVSRCAIQALLKKHKETGDVGDRRRSGRPRKISAADERRIMLTSLRKMSSRAISSELAETSGTQVHPSTVRRSLARSELHKRLEELLESEQEDNQLYLSQLPETLHNRENRTKSPSQTPSKKESLTETPQNKENMPEEYSSSSGSVHRGRGRPKGSKNKTFPVSPTKVYSVREGKSPVSSPKKHSDVKNENGVEAPSRGRGRPKGSTKVKPVVEDVPKKSRGRPKGSKNKKPTKAAVMKGSPASPKAGRGRPRKLPFINEDDDAPKRERGRPKGSLNKRSLKKLAMAIAMGTQEKRNRGRPKKILHPSAVLPLTPKRPRGRPKSTGNIVQLKRSEDYTNAEDEEDDKEKEDEEDDKEKDDDSDE